MQLANVKRLDVVWDQYFENSLKEQVRSARGEAGQIFCIIMQIKENYIAFCQKRYLKLTFPIKKFIPLT